jgi:hypothetical protein
LFPVNNNGEVLSIQLSVIRSSSTTKTGHHDIAEILLKVALSTINQNKIEHLGEGTN